MAQLNSGIVDQRQTQNGISDLYAFIFFYFNFIYLFSCINLRKSGFTVVMKLKWHKGWLNNLGCRCCQFLEIDNRIIKREVIQDVAYKLTLMEDLAELSWSFMVQLFLVQKNDTSLEMSLYKLYCNYLNMWHIK